MARNEERSRISCTRGDATTSGKNDCLARSEVAAALIEVLSGGAVLLAFDPFDVAATQRMKFGRYDPGQGQLGQADRVSAIADRDRIMD